MNPQVPQSTMSHLSPEILQALMARRAGGVGGGVPQQAPQQVMAPNPMGGPVGPSASPLATSPQPVPVANGLPSMPSSGAPGNPAQGQPSSASQGAGVDHETKAQAKALMQRLVRFL